MNRHDNDKVVYTTNLLNSYGIETAISNAVIVDSHITDNSDEKFRFDFNLLYDKRCNTILLTVGSVEPNGTANFPSVNLDKTQMLCAVVDGTKENVLTFAEKLETVVKTIKEVCAR